MRGTSLTLHRRSLAPLVVLVSLFTLGGCGHKEKEKANPEFGYHNTPSPQPETADRSTQDPMGVVPDNGIGTSHPQATYEEAEAAFQARRYDEAVSLFTAYTETRPQNVWGEYMLGLSAWKAGKLALAEQAFTGALTLDPGHEKSLLNLTRVLLEGNRAQEALPVVEKAIAQSPESAEAYRLRGRAQAQLGQTAQAEDAYRHALVLDEKDPWSMNNLGLLLIGEKRFEEAVPALARATELRPYSPVFLNNLGIALEGIGHTEEAARVFRAALDQDPSYAKASGNLTRVTSVPESPELGTIDLAAGAARFEEQIRTWRGDSASGETATGDSSVVALGGETSPQK